MYAYGRIKSNPKQATNLYTRQCSVNVNAKDLATMAATLANGGKNPITNKQVLEVYGATSQSFGDKAAGFRNSNEYLGGVNFYLANSRNYRFNAQVIRVNRSPVSSSFGYYVGCQKGVTVALAMSIFF